MGIQERPLWARVRNGSSLIMMGDADQIVPLAYADILSSQIPNSRVHVMNDAGHMFNLEQCDEFAQVVTSFLTK